MHFRNILSDNKKKKHPFRRTYRQKGKKFNFLSRNLKNKNAFQVHRFNIIEGDLQSVYTL